MPGIAMRDECSMLVNDYRLLMSIGKLHRCEIATSRRNAFDDTYEIVIPTVEGTIVFLLGFQGLRS
jgi:hypothetical protein